METNSENNEPFSTERTATIWSLVVLAIFLVFVSFTVLSAVSSVRSTPPLANCQSNMRNVALAILNYEAVNQHFPVAATRSEDGAPSKSWRVEILPQLELQYIRDRYDDSLPWDAPANLEVAKTQIPLFRCPAARQPSEKTELSTTNYVLITGPGTVFPDGKHSVASDIKDGFFNTIIMMEINDSDIAWSEPRDLTVDEAIALFNRPASVRKKHPTNHKSGRVVAFADGHIDFAPEDTPPEVLRALFHIDDGIAATLK